MKTVILSFKVDDGNNLRSVTVERNDTGIDESILMKTIPICMLRGIYGNENDCVSEAKDIIQKPK